MIKADIDNIVVDSPHVESVRFPETRLDSFSQLSEVDVRKIIIGSSNATCSLDPSDLLGSNYYIDRKFIFLRRKGPCLLEKRYCHPSA